MWKQKLLFVLVTHSLQHFFALVLSYFATAFFSQVTHVVVFLSDFRSYFVENINL